METAKEPKTVLFMFSQLNALDNVPLHWIKSVNVVGNNLLFNCVNDLGETFPLHKLRTDFIVNQIKGYEIQTVGEEL